MSRFLLHPLILSAIATAILWVLVVTYWQATGKQVSFDDIALYMVGLPLLVIGLAFAGRALYRRRQTASPQDKSGDGNNPPLDSSATEEVVERRFTLAVLASGVATAAGDDVATVYAELKAKSLRPAPDDEIRNAQGFPVVLTRVANLSHGEAEAALLQSKTPPPVTTLRAITLLKRAFTSLAEVLHSIALETVVSKNDPTDSPHPLPRLIVDLLVPATWDATSRRQVAVVANCLLADTGWPDEQRVLRTIDIGQCQSAAHLIDKFTLEANRTRSSDYYLVLACESLVDQETISEMEGRNELFGPTTPQGTVPGEAAAAVLLRRPTDEASDEAPTILIGRAAFAARNRSIDSPGRVGCEELVGAGQAAIEQAQLSPEHVTAVFSDIDQHSGRCAECFGALNELLPHVDPTEQFAAVGQAFGRLNSSGSLVAMAVAAEAVADEKQPVLLISALHDRARLAMPLWPAKQQAAT